MSSILAEENTCRINLKDEFKNILLTLTLFSMKKPGLIAHQVEIPSGTTTKFYERSARRNLSPRAVSPARADQWANQRGLPLP